MSFLDKQITIRLAVEFFFYNGVLFIPVYWAVSKWCKALARSLTESKVKRYERLLEASK